jgi:chemotaxis protein CheD
MEMINVGIGEYKVSKVPCILQTASLGSCVGVVLYDFTTKVSGMAHIMLPDSKLATARHMKATPKFADFAIASMLADMMVLGAVRGKITARMAGGACMFLSAIEDPIMNIGARNITAVQEILDKERIPVTAQDVGSNFGRTVIFDSLEDRFQIRSAKFGIKVI